MARFANSFLSRETHQRFFALAFLFVGFGLISGNIRQISGQDVPPITEKQFAKLFNEIDSPLDKPWRQIPWKISLLEAQKEAAQQQKPIFIWAMDGHPLGCT